MYVFFSVSLISFEMIFKITLKNSRNQIKKWHHYFVQFALCIIQRENDSVVYIDSDSCILPSLKRK